MHEIGALVDFGIQHPAVRGAGLQGLLHGPV
jgi:hypothetical protein